MADEPVKVTSGTQGSRVVVPPEKGHEVKDPVVALEDETHVVAEPGERDEVQVLPVEKDGSVGAKEGHRPEMRRVEDSEGKPRWRVEDGEETPPGFVVHVPPERGLEP